MKTVPEVFRALAGIWIIALIFFTGVAAAQTAGPFVPADATAKTPQNQIAGPNDRGGNMPLVAVPPGQDEIRAHPELFLEGNWRVEWRGNSKLSTADMRILKGLIRDSACSFEGEYEYCRDLNAPFDVLTEGTRGPDGRLAGHHVSIKMSPDGGTIEVIHQTDAAGPITSVLHRQAGEPDVLTGHWQDGDDNTGTEIWHREPRPEIRAVECYYHDKRTDSTATEACTVVVPEYPGHGAMRGNLPSMRFDVFGAHMRGAGPLPVFIDWQQSHLEIDGFCYLYEKPFAEGQRHGCASWGVDSPQYGKIIGVSVNINVVHGATPGLRTFWIGGQPVAFNLKLPNIPEDVKPKDTIDLAVSPLLAAEASTELRFAIRNRGDSDATNIKLSLSSDQPFCPYEAGCEGDVVPRTTKLCPFGSPDPSAPCSQCTLSGDVVSGDAAAHYTCPGATLRPGDVADTRFVIDPKPKQGSQPAADDKSTCYAGHTITMAVSARETDTDESNNHADVKTRHIPSAIESLQFVALDDKDLLGDDLRTVEQAYAGQTLLVEAVLDKPMCDWVKPTERYGIRPPIADLALSSVYSDLNRNPPVGVVNTELRPIARDARTLRSEPFQIGDIFDEALKKQPRADRETARPGDKITARAADKTSQATLAAYNGPVTVKLTVLDAFDNPLPTREILEQTGTFRAEVVFLDGHGPFPDQPTMDIALTGERAGEALESSQKVTLQRQAPGRYVSKSLEVKNIAVRAGDALIANYAYAGRAADGADRLSVVESNNPWGQIAMAQYPGGTQLDLFDHLNVGDRITFKVEGESLPGDPERLDVVATGRRGETGTVVAQTQLTAVRTGVGRWATEPLAVGTDGPLAALRPGDEIRGYVGQYDKKTHWRTIDPTAGKPIAIQVLPLGPSGALNSDRVVLGEKFQIRLSFAPDEHSDATSLPVRLTRERSGETLAERRVLLTPASNAPNLYLSDVFEAGPATFPAGLEPRDLIKATFVSEAPAGSDVPGAGGNAQELEGTAVVAAPPDMVDKITLTTGGDTSSAAGTVATDGTFRAFVSFKRAPYGEPEPLELRVVHDTQAAAEVTVDLAQESDWDKTTLTTPAISLANDRRFGRLAVGDRIEARYGDGEWAPTPSAALNVIGTPGRIESVRFVENGRPTDKLPVGAKAVVEVVYEKPPPASSRPAGVALSTGANFNSAEYDPAKKQNLMASLAPVDADPRRFRTRPVALVGAQSTDARPSGPSLSVTPGYRITASLANHEALVTITGRKAKDGEGTVTVTVFNGFGYPAVVDVRAKGLDGQGNYRFLTNSPAHLPAGAYRLNIEFPHFHRRDIALKAGEDKPVEIPRADVGSLRVQFHNGKGEAVKPTRIVATRYSGGPENWASVGEVHNTTDMDLPRGIYDVSATGPNGLRFDFTEVKVTGGDLTLRRAGFESGRLNVTLSTADGEAQKTPFFALSATDKDKTIASGTTSTKAVDAKNGVMDVHIPWPPFDPVIQDVKVNTAAETPADLRLGRLDVAGYTFGADTPGKVDVTIKRLTVGGADRSQWSGRAGMIDVPPGKYEVTFQQTGERQVVDVAQGQKVPVTQKLRLARLKIAQSTAFGRAGQFLTAGFYYSVKKDGREVARAKTGRDFTRTPLEVPAGQLRVELHGLSQGRVFATTVNVAPGKTATATIDNYGSAVVVDPVVLKSAVRLDLYFRRSGETDWHKLIQLKSGNNKAAPIFLVPGRYEFRLTDSRFFSPDFRETVSIAKGIATPMYWRE